MATDGDGAMAQGGRIASVNLRADPSPGTPTFHGPPAFRKCLLALSVAAALGWALFVAAHGNQVDIDVYRFGGRHIFHPDLYSARLGTLYFTYTPFAALVFSVPSLILNTLSLQVVWALTNVIALAGLTYVSIRITLPRLGPRRSAEWALLLLTPAMALDPVFINIGLGQINLVLTLMILLDLAGRRGDPHRKLPLGVATGLAAAIKLTPLIFVPYLVLTRRVRGAFNAAATFVACEALAYVVAPHDSWIYWTKDVFDSKRAGALLYTSDQNLTSVLQRFHHGPVPGSVTDPAIVVLGVVGLLLAAQAHRRSSVLLGLLVTAATELVVSPITWVHHMVWIVPVLIWLALAPDRPRRGPVIAAVTAFVFVIAPIWWVPRSYVVSANPPELHEHGWQLVAGNFFFIATIAFLVGVAVMLWLRARSSRGHVGERQDGLPVPGGGAGGQTPLEGGVGELRPAVAVGTKQVDLAARDPELLGTVTSGQRGDKLGGRNVGEEGHMQRGEIAGPVHERVVPADDPELGCGPEKGSDVES
jgi:alpha-1,2-mannosyltransferase